MSWLKDAIATIKPSPIPTVEDCLRSFIKAHGKNCCASCDHWHYHNSVVGECHKSAPVSGAERMSMIGIRLIGVNLSAGHVITPRDHVCGEWELMTEGEDHESY